ncbi:hypothetical protein K1728_01935 [Weissella confusa]|uniref:hypothetical protein n=1 Tax=Weissella confusa TaxID=1583 RepID=UPI001C6FAF35|nr:hypothetical protein [Weissella confusa]QYU58198.1 hypothetical protein K1728_01935 [Weissella confusa]
MDIPEQKLRMWFIILSSKKLFTLIERDGYKIKLISRNTIAVYGHDEKGTEVGQWFFRSEIIDDDPHQNTRISEERTEQEQLALF